MWKVRTKIVSLETFKKGLDQNLQLLPGHTATRYTNEHSVHVFRKVLG